MSNNCCPCPCSNFEYTALTNFFQNWQLGVVLPFGNHKMNINQISTKLDGDLNVGNAFIEMEAEFLQDSLLGNNYYTDYIQDIDGNIINNFNLPDSSHLKYQGMGYEDAIKYKTDDIEFFTQNNAIIAARDDDACKVKYLPSYFTLHSLETTVGYTTKSVNLNVENHSNMLIINHNDDDQSAEIKLPVISLNRINTNFGNYNIRLYYKANEYVDAFINIKGYDKNDVNIFTWGRSIHLGSGGDQTTWELFNQIIDFQDKDMHYLEITLKTNGRSAVEKGVFQLAYPCIFHSYNIGKTGLVHLPIQPSNARFGIANIQESYVKNDNATSSTFRSEQEKYKYRIEADFSLYPSNEFDVLQTLTNLCLNGEDIILFPFSEQLPPFLIGNMKLDFDYKFWDRRKLNFRLIFVEN